MSVICHSWHYHWFEDIHETWLLSIIYLTFARNCSYLLKETRNSRRVLVVDKNNLVGFILCGNKKLYFKVFNSELVYPDSRNIGLAFMWDGKIQQVVRLQSTRSNPCAVKYSESETIIGMTKWIWTINASFLHVGLIAYAHAVRQNLKRDKLQWATFPKCMVKSRKSFGYSPSNL